MSFIQALQASWCKPNWLTVLLLPLSGIYWLAYQLRKFAYNSGLKKQYQANVPVIVVGNLTVGGTGKTPFVICLVEKLQALGYKPGVISRGYGSRAQTYPLLINEATDVTHSGDEPALIVRHTGAPMVIGPDRGADIDLLLSSSDCDVIISDDGLQHLALKRDIELCLVDKSTELQNNLMLPAGPFREPLGRLKSVDWVVEHVSLKRFGQTDGHIVMALLASEPQPLVARLEDDSKLLNDSKPLHNHQLAPQLVNAVAGIGNPRRFFDTCKELGFELVEHIFADHHQFTQTDFEFDNRLPVLMTEKDAVKCQSFAKENMWFLPVKAQVSGDLVTKITQKLEAKTVSIANKNN